MVASAEQALRWDLGDLYRGAADPRLKEDLEAAATEARDLAARARGRIAEGRMSPRELGEVIGAYERVLERGTRPSFYASLLFAADTQSREAQALEQWARETWSAIRETLLFFDLELRRIPDSLFELALEDPAVRPYRYLLEHARRYRSHTLSEPEEKVLNRKELTSRDAFVQLYDELTGSLRFELEIDGETRTLTDGEVLALLHRPERELRRRALETFLGTYRRHELVLGAVFDNLLLDHRLETELREFESPIAFRHLENDIGAETVEAMIDAIDRHAPDVQEYFLLKARVLGLPQMEVSDVYAPIREAPARLPFAGARDLVLESFSTFSPVFERLARRFFEQGWIDAELRPGKRAGAFCASHAPGQHPYVLASYTGTPRDVSTIAHELGHGAHALCAGRQPFLLYEAPLVLAETASVFAEMLLAEQYLRRAASPDDRARILCDSLDDLYATVFRQNALTRFELAAHAARREGPLGAEDIGRLWMETQAALFGDAVLLPEVYRHGWIYIPHFVHSPFYCYAYSFGNLLVLSLFERYRAEGPSFVPGYLELLEAGGSERPEALLERIGADVSKPDFWEGGLRVIRGLIDELAAVVENH